jgi:hypothetical protein
MNPEYLLRITQGLWCNYYGQGGPFHRAPRANQNQTFLTIFQNPGIQKAI